jgi:hypothetical protein
MYKKLKDFEKSIYTYMKKKALSFEEDPSAQLTSYRANFKKTSNRNFTQSSIPHLLKAVEDSNVVYLGDFHSLGQNTRNFERIISSLEESKDDFVIAMEVVHIDYQDEIDHYLKKYITELEFLEYINYHDSWRFPWSQYKLFFDYALNHKIKILALNTEGTLEDRDRAASKIIAKQLEQSPRTQVFVIFGELHLAHNKIPQFVKNELSQHQLAGNFKDTIIHQNLDEVFWKLYPKAIHGGRVLKFNDREFSLQTTAPWIKYESMVYWYENLTEDPDFDIHEYLLEKGINTFNSETDENFLYISNKILSFLNITDVSDIDDFELFDHVRLELVYQKVQKIDHSSFRSLYNQLIGHSKSFRIIGTNNYYCSSYSINRLSFLSGVHVFSNILPMQYREFDKKVFKYQSCERLIYFIYEFTFAYFATKIVNPYKKCDLYLDLKRNLEEKTLTSDKLKAIEMTIKILDDLGDKKVDLDLYRVNLKTIYRVSKFIGQIIGENLYRPQLEAPNILINLIRRGNFKPSGLAHLFSSVFPNQEYKNQLKRRF